MNIHFICRGNVLRSLIAETYLKSLELKNITTVSSGTNVNWHDLQEKEYFANTLAILQSHHIRQYAKAAPQQLTQQRIDQNDDIVVCMNQRVIDEASKLVHLPVEVLNWHITDIGEGERTDGAHREMYEEEIYQEIIQKVDSLVGSLSS